MNTPVMSDRAQVLLKHLIELYIRDGQPVGSKTLVHEAFQGLSPASVRKVLCDLEEQGYLTSPHPSAGRLPTTRGIRFFVDSLLSVYPIDDFKVKRVKKQFEQSHHSVNSLVTAASHVLSELTHMVGIVTLPKSDLLILRHVEFLSLSENRVLVVIVLNEQEVQNRIITTERQYSATELTQASNFINFHFAGKEWQTACQELLQAINQDRCQLDHLMKTVVEVATQVFLPEASQGEYVLSGQEHLFAQPLTSVSQLKKVFEAFTQKQAILHLLARCLHSNRVQMFIGEESGYEAFREYSVITSRYHVEGQTIGVLGVIGPTRMPYNRVIPIVELTAKILGTSLNFEKASPS